MFESLSKSLGEALRKLRGRGRLTEDNIKEGLREVRIALLEADVSYKVVKDFIQKVTERAVGEQVIKSVTPGQQIVKIVHDELVSLMGPVDSSIPFASQGITVIMLAGLQGSGKTTTSAKLAKLLQSKGRHPLLVAADVIRPAAIEQLKILGQQLNIPVYSEQGSRAPKICQNALKHAEQTGRDVAILDTQGRLHVDAEMMAEVREIAEKVKPHQIFLVCDAMTGQDAVNSAAEFNRQLELTGVILTKLDGDARGGAALSVKAVTGKPIKFVGVGEKLDRLEEFHPDRMASRILGMGDVVTLVEKAQLAIDEEKAEELEKKIRKDQLSLDDFLDQLQQVKKMGPLKEILSMIPGLGSKMEGVQVDEGQLKRVEAIIRSMTPEERAKPDLVDHSRRHRIAKGSGTATHDVNQLLKQFRQMRKTLKHISMQEEAMVAPKHGLAGLMAKRKR